MRLVRLALLAVATLLLVACSSAGSAPSWTLGPTAPESSAGPSAAASGGAAASPSTPASAPASPTSAPSASAASSPAASGSPAGGNRIEVKLTDQLKMEPASIDVPVGVPVTFVVTNTGALAHEFFLGDEQAQADHEKAMTGSTTPPPDSANGIGLEPGQTKELTHTFQTAGTSLAGCHVAGHYLAGMKATITVK